MNVTDSHLIGLSTQKPALNVRRRVISESGLAQFKSFAQKDLAAVRAGLTNHTNRPLQDIFERNNAALASATSKRRKSYASLRGMPQKEAEKPISRSSLLTQKLKRPSTEFRYRYIQDENAAKEALKMAKIENLAMQFSTKYSPEQLKAALQRVTKLQELNCQDKNLLIQVPALKLALNTHQNKAQKKEQGEESALIDSLIESISSIPTTSQPDEINIIFRELRSEYPREIVKKTANTLFQDYKAQQDKTPALRKKLSWETRLLARLDYSFRYERQSSHARLPLDLRNDHPRT